MATRVHDELTAMFRNLVAPLFPADMFNYINNKLYAGGLDDYYRDRCKLRAEITLDDGTSEYKVDVGVLSDTAILSFKVRQYPSCCAVMMFHTFKYNERLIEKKDVFAILDWTVLNVLGRCMGFATRRLNVMMVEKREGFSAMHGEKYQFMNIPERPRNDVTIVYPWFFEYFHKQRRVNTRLLWNKNTSNIIHDMEVLFKGIHIKTEV